MDETTLWPTDAGDYELLGLIGHGAFAKVYKGRCKVNNCIVAIKVLSLEDVSSSISDLWREVLSMKLCNHPNIIQCHCCFCVNDHLWIVTPFMSKGSLLRILQYLKQVGKLDGGEGLPEDVISAVLKQAAQGLQYLHSSNLLHRDVKAGNILVNSDGSVCLADLGVSRIMEGAMKKAHARTFVGTPCWMAPEVMSRSDYNASADIWSLGITAMELFKGFPPYAQYEPMEAIIRTCQGDPPFFSTYGPSAHTPSHAFHSWVEMVLKKAPEERPSLSRLLNHRFLSRFSDDRCREILREFVETIPDLASDPLAETATRGPSVVPKWKFLFVCAKQETINKKRKRKRTVSLAATK